MRRRQFATLGVAWPALFAFPKSSRAQRGAAADRMVVAGG